MISTGRLPHRGPRRDPRTAAGSFQNAQNFGQTRQNHSQDKHWDECIPKEIPYTIAAEKYKKKEFEGSAQVDRLHNELIIMWKNFHIKTNISKFFRQPWTSRRPTRSTATCTTQGAWLMLTHFPLISRLFIMISLRSTNFDQNICSGAFLPERFPGL